MGIDKRHVYLVGSSNVGKSTVFAAMMKRCDRPWIANFSGSTCDIRISDMPYGQLIDTPGLDHLYVASPSWVEDIRSDPNAVLIFIMDARHWLRDAVVLSQWSKLGKPMSALVMHTDHVTYHAQALIGVMEQVGVPVALSNHHDKALEDTFNQLRLGARVMHQHDRIDHKDLDDQMCISMFNQTSQDDVKVMKYWLEKAHHLWHPMQFKRVEIGKWSSSVDRFLWRSKSAIWILSGLLFSVLFMLIICAQFLSIMVVDWIDWGIGQWWLQLEHPYLIQCLKGLLVWVALLPSIVVARGFTSWIEQSGFAQRLMVLGSRLFRSLGLSVHSWIPMMMSFNCNVVALDLIEGESPVQRQRLSYILPMIPCSARWTVGVILTSVLPPLQAVVVLLCGYILSLSLVILLASWTVSPDEVASRPLVLTPLCWPDLWVLSREVYYNSLSFMAGLLKWLLPVQLVMNACMTLTTSGQWTHVVEDSMLACAAKSTVWLFHPMGLTQYDWPWVAGLLPGLIAKEAMISVWLPLSQSVQMDHTPLVIMSFLAWSWLYVPCLGTVRQMMRFVGYKAWIYTLFTFILGYCIACAIAQNWAGAVVCLIAVLLKVAPTRYRKGSGYAVK